MNFHDFLKYEQGILVRKKKPEHSAKDKTWNTRYSGPIKYNKLRKNGYLVFMVDGVKCNAHRVVYEMHHGPIPDGMFVDHINGNRADNRIENLRVVRPKGNAMNMGKAKNNTSGVVGVYWSKRRQNWRAGIKVDKKYIELGAFLSFEAAVDARRSAEALYGFIDNGRRG